MRSKHKGVIGRGGEVIGRDEVIGEVIERLQSKMAARQIDKKSESRLRGPTTTATTIRPH